MDVLDRGSVRVEPPLARPVKVAIVAFVMTGTRPPAAPPWLCLRPIPELNVRTYVRVGGTPGVWFLSLDASSPLFARLGRELYGLRYRVARMAVAAEGASGAVHYLSSRAGAAFAASYRSCGPPARARRGSLEYFLVERYRLFSQRHGRLVTATVAHEPWLLQPAEVRIELNRMAPTGIAFEGEPLVHFARGVEARISAPVVVPHGSRGFIGLGRELAETLR